MGTQRKEYISKVLGVIFVLAGLGLGGIYLFVETRKEVPESWIIGLILGGLLLILAKEKLIGMIERFLPKKSEK